eukprot:640865-Amphidinium_carterae.1
MILHVLEQGAALSATSARELILAILRDSGATTTVSTQWVRTFMKAMGLSYKVGDIRQQPKPSNDEVTDARYKLRMKLIYLMHLEKVKPEDIWNIDETAC